MVPPEVVVRKYPDLLAWECFKDWSRGELACKLAREAFFSEEVIGKYTANGWGEKPGLNTTQGITPPKRGDKEVDSKILGFANRVQTCLAKDTYTAITSVQAHRFSNVCWKWSSNTVPLSSCQRACIALC